MQNGRIARLTLVGVAVPLGVVVLLYVYLPNLLPPLFHDAPPPTHDSEPISSMLVSLCETRRPDGSYPACCADIVGSGTGTATLLFAGDTAEVDAVLPILEREGFDYPFAATADTIREADVAIANVEAPITDGGERFPLWKEYVYRAPSASAAALARAGFDIAGLANNHTMDYGPSGLADTTAGLGRAGIVPLGAGTDEDIARRPVIVRAGRVTVGILARCERQVDWEHYVRQYARADHPGVAMLDEGQLALDIAALRSQVDLVIVSVHWGNNYEPPTAAMLAEAKAIVAAGADLVVGHHPHMVHPLTVIDGVPVALSLGNYAFGTLGHPQLTSGALLRVVIEHKKIIRLELLPLDTQNQRTNYRPVLLHGDAARRALAPIIEQSAPLGAELKIGGGDGDGDRAVLLVSGRKSTP